MLTRVLFFMCVCSFARAESLRPHVVLIQLNEPAVGDKVEPLTKVGVFASDAWLSQRGECRVNPGRSAIQTALLFGTSPLQQGVVHDLDWRRKPVDGETLADSLSGVGYQTYFYGAWALGAAAPYDPESRGFHQAHYFEAGEEDTLTDAWGTRVAQPVLIKNTKKPIFIHMAEGRHLSREMIFQTLAGWVKDNQQPTVVVILEAGVGSKKKFYYPAKWVCLSNQNFSHQLDVNADWDLYRVVRRLAALDVEPKLDLAFFHRANWPVHESIEKNRHRGSLVLGQDLALIDGLHMYRVKDSILNFNESLDTAKYQQDHQALLAAHGKWWRMTGENLYNPRAFDIGSKDHQVVRLTALDWQMSKIRDSENGRPTTSAMVYQKYLVDILAGLKNDLEYKNKFPAYSGSWAVHMKRPGRYKITASLLPRDTKNASHRNLMKLEGGNAYIRLGDNVATLRVTKGATAITLQTDAGAGITDLECWFTGQLALTRELGAFFVEIERVGDRKFDLQAKPQD